MSDGESICQSGPETFTPTSRHCRPPGAPAGANGPRPGESGDPNPWSATRNPPSGWSTGEKGSVHCPRLGELSLRFMFTYLALVSPPVALALDVFARSRAEIGRADDED